jgi:polygalacturonase
MHNKYLTFFLVASLTWPCGLTAREYNILDFGASSDTAVLSTGAIQKAIDECSAGDGGRVMIPAGHYKTGTIIIKSNVELYLEQGAVLFGSRNLKDYLPLKPEYVSLRTQEATIQLIYAENARNIGITGFGEIDGQGSSFKKLSWNDEGITRPHLLRFINCRYVTMEHISLRNSGCWMQHYLACEEMHIHGLRIFNRNNFNNDGIDIDGCRNVIISDIISDSDDDGITLKSTSPRPCENITITNCVISSRCNAIKMGTESNGGFLNISISNCVVKPSQTAAPAFFGNANGTSGIALEIVDGGIMKGIAINNIEINGTASPIFIRLGNRARSYSKNVEINNVGSLSDVSINQVRIQDAGNIGCSITGQPGYKVRNVRLSNIYIEQAGGCGAEELLKEVPEKPKDYPEATMFGVLPAYGFYIRHAADIHFENIEFAYQQKDLRPALYLNDVESSGFNNITMLSDPDNQANILMEQVKDIIVRNTSLKGNTKCFVLTNGKDIEGVFLFNNFLGAHARVFTSEGAKTDIVEQGNIIR